MGVEMGDSDMIIGELTASVHSLERRLEKMELKLDNLVLKQIDIDKKISSSRWFVLGLMAASGLGGATAGPIISKIIGG